MKKTILMVLFWLSLISNVSAQSGDPKLQGKYWSSAHVQAEYSLKQAMEQDLDFPGIFLKQFNYVYNDGSAKYIVKSNFKMDGTTHHYVMTLVLFNGHDDADGWKIKGLIIDGHKYL